MLLSGFGAAGLVRAVWCLQKVLLGGIALAVMFSLLRFVLWGVLSLCAPRFAKVLSSLASCAAAFFVIADPSLRPAALDFGYRVACSFLWGAHGAGVPLTGGWLE